MHSSFGSLLKSPYELLAQPATEQGSEQEAEQQWFTELRFLQTFSSPLLLRYRIQRSLHEALVKPFSKQATTAS